MKSQEKWDLRYLKLAKEVASWSKDPSTQTGAVITRNNRVVSVGYNGFPEGMEDDDRLNNRDLKYETIVHCEDNAASNIDVRHCTLYTWPFHSCSRCASRMITHGIERCVAPINTNPRWTANLELSAKSFKECGVELVLYDFPTT